MTSVVVARIAERDRQRVRQRLLLVEEPGGLAADAHGHRRIDRADVAHQLLRLLAERRGRGATRSIR